MSGEKPFEDDRKVRRRPLFGGRNPESDRGHLTNPLLPRIMDSYISTVELSRASMEKVVGEKYWDSRPGKAANSGNNH